MVDNEGTARSDPEIKVEMHGGLPSYIVEDFENGELYSLKGITHATRRNLVEQLTEGASRSEERHVKAMVQRGYINKDALEKLKIVDEDGRVVDQAKYKDLGVHKVGKLNTYSHYNTKNPPATIDEIAPRDRVAVGAVDFHRSSDFTDDGAWQKYRDEVEITFIFDPNSDDPESSIIGKPENLTFSVPKGYAVETQGSDILVKSPDGAVAHTYHADLKPGETLDGINTKTHTAQDKRLLGEVETAQDKLDGSAFYNQDKANIFYDPSGRDRDIGLERLEDGDVRQIAVVEASYNNYHLLRLQSTSIDRASKFSNDFDFRVRKTDYAGYDRDARNVGAVIVTAENGEYNHSIVKAGVEDVSIIIASPDAQSVELDSQTGTVVIKDGNGKMIADVKYQEGADFSHLNIVDPRGAALLGNADVTKLQAGESVSISPGVGSNAKDNLSFIRKNPELSMSEEHKEYLGAKQAAITKIETLLNDGDMSDNPEWEQQMKAEIDKALSDGKIAVSELDSLTETYNRHADTQSQDSPANEVIKHKLEVVNDGGGAPKP